MTKDSEANAVGVERAWEALKARCCADPGKAVRCVMVTREDFAAALTSMGEGWQPIETAPKERDDYSWSPTFMAWQENYGDPFPCKQRGGSFYDLEIVDRDGDWSEVIPPPTHWRQFPPPPAISRGDHMGEEA